MLRQEMASLQENVSLDVENPSAMPRSDKAADVPVLVLRGVDSAEVAGFALKFMYTGCLDCTFADQGGKLYGLLQLCSEYGLPMPLQEFAQKRLLRLVADPMSS